MDSRQTLKLVAPFKRPIILRLTQNSRNKSEIENPFFPKELANIIVIRQRRERAWYTCLLLCTSMISSIDSTLVNFKEVEMEEVVAFKASLRQAIANFVAVDSFSPSLISSHNRPNKGNGSKSGKDKNTNNILVATPLIVPTPAPNRRKTQRLALPKTSPISDKTWVTMARNSHKKAKVFLGNKAQAAFTANASQRQSPKDKPATLGSDKGLFVRLPQGHV